MDTIDRSTGPCTGGIEKLSLSPLLDIIKNGSADCIEAPLEDLHRLFLSKSWKQSSPDTLLQTWRVCTFLLDKLDLQPEVGALLLQLFSCRRIAIGDHRERRSCSQQFHSSQTLDSADRQNRREMFKYRPTNLVFSISIFL